MAIYIKMLLTTDKLIPRFPLSVSLRTT